MENSGKIFFPESTIHNWYPPPPSPLPVMSTEVMSQAQSHLDDKHEDAR